MKNKFFAVLALVAFAASAYSQTISSSPPPGGVGIAATPIPATPTGVAGISNPSSPVSFHYNVTNAQIAALGAATSGDITLFTLPARSVIDQTLVKPYVAVAGTSYSAATARVITATNNYGTAFDVFQAVGATVFDWDGTHPKVENFATTTPVLLHMTSTGGNLSATTAGSIDVWVTWHQLP
jgi:hypothetical protein